MRFDALKGWTSEQKSVVVATYLGWALDAFDYFIFVFVLESVAREFGVPLTEVTIAILLTLAMRPVGAYIFAGLRIAGVGGRP